MPRSSFTPHSAVGPPSPTVFAVETVTGTASRSKLSNSRELTPTFDGEGNARRQADGQVLLSVDDRHL